MASPQGLGPQRFIIVGLKRREKRVSKCMQPKPDTIFSLRKSLSDAVTNRHDGAQPAGRHPWPPTARLSHVAP